MNITELYTELQIMEWFVSKVRNDIKQLEDCAPDGKYLSETDDEYNKRSIRPKGRKRGMAAQRRNVCNTRYYKSHKIRPNQNNYKQIHYHQ